MEKIILASGPVIVEDGRVMLNQHGDTTFWKFCGGKAERFQENLIETAKREVKEEMGIDIEILDEEPYIFFTRQEKETELIDVILVHFLAKRIGEIELGEDITDWQWFELDKLPENLAPNILPTLKYFKFIKE